MKRWISLTFLALALAGCSSPTAVKPVVYGPGYPANDTPQHAVQRLVGTYERKVATDYQRMFTGDFTFEFSNETDPVLVQQYSTGWFKIDEKESSNHLFTGYTPPGEPTRAAASSIVIHLTTDLPSDDPGSADPRTHKVLTTRVDGTVSIPEITQPLTMEITNNLDEIHLVRGDAAVGLDSTQVADSLHWYVYRWVDLTAAPAAQSPSREPTPTQTATWGLLKGMYR